jgi:hypothetical protein
MQRHHRLCWYYIAHMYVFRESLRIHWCLVSVWVLCGCSVMSILSSSLYRYHNGTTNDGNAYSNDIHIDDDAINNTSIESVWSSILDDFNFFFQHRCILTIAIDWVNCNSWDALMLNKIVFETHSAALATFDTDWYYQSSNITTHDILSISWSNRPTITLSSSLFNS